MRALIQRVSSASVSVDGEVVGRIWTGLVVLLGVSHSDGDAQAERLADKVSQLRVFEGEQGRMDRSLLDVGGAVLCVSQFTLYGDTRRGLRPSFTEAAEPALAERLYELFCERMRHRGLPVETGRFAARMSLSLTNDGPVTLLLEA
jgi:D-tyrosyl-tRNA(Tyr) deacylase